ncbi:uncharacterized protein PFL1_01001 [Pseudozyma flocculosa PF-1]|uniref:1-alkyl-2-acetylglycerophosphocholine esterase n=1 Tax=Pseudozyma flocculosa TaxID=84751 RepID=A0A5C3FAT5_9BASI|nr:uncharacterized protein PFL1_01001 [Pseudozyma flocculosa PF-1]EPQ31668.1 hypothetical protein PFL1_01001 [Pseudozyma flocculosa PF-1]SPO40785.1 related to platelet-activating factor acetylhydrolase precursor [Pseudozyma flocculosa]
MSLPRPRASSPYGVSTLTLEVPLDTPIHSPQYTDINGGGAVLSTSTVLLTLYYPCDVPPSTTSSSTSKAGHDSPSWLEPPKLRSITGLLKYAGVPKFLAPAIVLPAWGVVGQRLPCLAHQPLYRQEKDRTRTTTIVLSHGLGGTRTTYSTLCIGLAARGNIVAAIEHRDGTAACTTTLHPSGSADRDGAASRGLWSWFSGGGGSAPTSTAKTYVRPDEVAEKPDPMVFRRAQLEHRQAEVAAALQVLRRIDAGDGLAVAHSSTRSPTQPLLDAIATFAHRLDLDRPWIAGHSFGAATALEVVRRDDCPFSRALLMDPWVEPIELDSLKARPVRRPVYTINSEHFTCWKGHMADVVEIMKGARAATGQGWLCTLSAEPTTDAAAVPAATAAASPQRDESDPNRLVVVHDMFGTLFSLTAPTEALVSLFPSQLSPDASSGDGGGGGVPPITAELIVMDWFHATQRDFTYRSVSGGYTPIGAVFKATLPRVLLQAGLLPRASNGGDALSQAGSGLDRSGDHALVNPYGDEVVDAMMASLKRLAPRPGMEDTFRSIYRDRRGEGTLHPSITKVDLWAATNGSLELGRSSFLRVLGDIDGGDLDVRPSPSSSSSSSPSPSSSTAKGDATSVGEGVGLFSCDEIEVAKPDMRVYDEVLQRVDKRAGQRGLWFVASHKWDLYAAKRAGFKTAWVTYEEHYACHDVFGTPDIVATDLADCARQILVSERRQRDLDAVAPRPAWRYVDEEAYGAKPYASQHTAFSDFPFLLPGRSFDGTVSALETMHVLVDLCHATFRGRAQPWTGLESEYGPGDASGTGTEKREWSVWKEGRPAPSHATGAPVQHGEKKRGRIVVHSLE